MVFIIKVVDILVVEKKTVSVVSSTASWVVSFISKFVINVVGIVVVQEETLCVVSSLVSN